MPMLQIHIANRENLSDPYKRNQYKSQRKSLREEIKIHHSGSAMFSAATIIVENWGIEFPSKKLSVLL